jgi:hypothetical protein
MASVSLELAQLAERLESLRRDVEAGVECERRLRRLRRENRRLRWLARRWRAFALVLVAGAGIVFLGRPEAVETLLRALPPVLGGLVR